MQRLATGLRGVLMRPRATLVLIACLTGLALVTSGLAYIVDGPPASAVPGNGASSTSAADVTVTLYDNHIESSRATFMPGARYHFTVVNKGMIDHELMLMPQVMGHGMGSGMGDGMGDGMGSMSMDQLDHMALARTGDMNPSVTRTFDYTFPPAMAGHHLEFGCYYPGHYESGMHLTITLGG